MGTVGTRASLIFPRRVLPGISWTPPLDDGVGSNKGINKEDCTSVAQALTAPVANLIQHFEGLAICPQMLPQQDYKEQVSEVEKPQTPPKRETPPASLQRDFGTETGKAAGGSPVSPLEQLPACTEDLSSILMSSILDSKDQEHTTESPDKLPAYWPASLPAISTDSPPPASQPQPLEVPLLTPLREAVECDSLPAKGVEAGKKLASAGRQRLKTYAELLAEETAAMKNALGPWQPPLEKSSKLMEFEDTTEKLRRMARRLQPLRAKVRPNKAPASQKALSLVADASAATRADRPPAADAPLLCFNGGQVLMKQPKWVLDIQRRPLTLLPRAARPRRDGVEQGCDAAEAAARRLMAQASVAALAEASQHAAASGLASPDQRAPPAAMTSSAVLKSAGYLAWVGLEDGIDMSARMCGAVLQSIPIVGSRLAAPEPDLAVPSPSLSVKLLRRSLKLAYGTAGNVVGFGEGLAYLAKQL